MQLRANHSEVDHFIRTVERSPVSVLLLDYDVTLGPFRGSQPAVPYPRVSTLLQEIVDTARTRLTIIAGHRCQNVDLLLSIYPSPQVWGLRGLQLVRINGTHEMSELNPSATQALADAERWLTYQGLQEMSESKPCGLAVHWHGLDDNTVIELRSRILLGWVPIAERGSLAVIEFDGGIELRGPDQGKGDAIRAILREIAPGVPIAYLGDDMTDEPVFQALQHRGLTVLVHRERRKTSARAWLRSPEELLEFLTRWRDACRTNILAESATHSG